MYYYGKVDEYEIVSTNISYENGVTYVELGVDAEYETGKTFNEIFEYVYEDKNEGYMIAIDVPTE